MLQYLKENLSGLSLVTNNESKWIVASVGYKTSFITLTTIGIPLLILSTEVLQYDSLI